MDYCIFDGSMCLSFDYNFHRNQRSDGRTLFAVDVGCFYLCERERKEQITIFFFNQFFFDTKSGEKKTVNKNVMLIVVS